MKENLLVTKKAEWWNADEMEYDNKWADQLYLTRMKKNSV